MTLTSRPALNPTLEIAERELLDMMRRTVNIGEAISTLKLPYTYELIHIPREKRESRKQLGQMVIPILQTMLDEMLSDCQDLMNNYEYARIKSKQASSDNFEFRDTRSEREAEIKETESEDSSVNVGN